MNHSPRGVSVRASSADLLLVVNELQILLHESAVYHQDLPDVERVYRESVHALRSFSRRLSKAADRYVVAVVGLTNVGKSTFLNALLGMDLAPRRNGPCTSSAIEFHHGQTLRVTARSRRSIRRHQWNCANVAEVHKRLASIVDDAGELATSDIHSVKVEAPITALRHGLIIADTPGFGAAQLGGKEGTHEGALKSYLQDDVSQVLWVVLAEQGIGKTEKSFHDSFFADVCDDVIVTGCEGWDPDDQLRFKRRFGEEFSKPLLRFHFISGLQGLVARNCGDEVGLESSGIKALEARITELANSDGRVAAIENALRDFAVDLREWISAFRSHRHEKLAEWWRPDSWSRWTSSCPGDSLRHELSLILKP
jgi:GTP-binding protein EngB required for normal cell division